jgi:hypothetical protein
LSINVAFDARATDLIPKAVAIATNWSLSFASSADFSRASAAMMCLLSGAGLNPRA